MKRVSFKILVACLMVIVIYPLQTNAKTKKKKADTEKSILEDLSLNILKFRSIGPALTSGRISDFAINPDNNSEFYVAASAGGVWKTTNAGVTFKPVFDDQGSFSIGCIEMDPSNHNVIWVGSGENNNQRSVSYGDGLYKSIDGGASWKKVGLENSEHIGMIVIDPNNTDVVYVAAYGPVWSAGGDRGIYKTTDGGETWEQVLFVSENTGFNEIHMDPRNSNVLYAAAHQRRRRQWTQISGGPESGIYKSVDAGKNWIKINKGLPAGDKGRIGMAISPANPEVIFAVLEAKRGQSGFFKSTNRGASWEKLSSTSTSGNYYQEIVADPVDVNRIYLMNSFTLVSVDGGKTFNTRGENSKHWDNHCLWIDPKNPLHHMEGSDGGVYESFDRGETWRFFTNLSVTQFYKVSTDNDYPFYNVMGGTQDNYSMVGPSQTISDHGIVTSDWTVTVTGDGFESVADPTDPNIVYAQAQYGYLGRFDKRSGELVYIRPTPPKGGKQYNYNWDAPLMISPHNHKTLYYAANKLLKSTDRGDSWEEVSGELDRNIDRNLWPVMGKVWPMDAVAKNGSTSRYGACVSLDESRLQEGLIYAGTDDGQINITEDGGKTWRQINQFPGVPEYTYVYDIIADKLDVNVVYAAFNNHKAGDFKPYVLKSTDKGKTWFNIAGNLPEKGSVYALEQDHINANILFAGTEYGVFVSIDGGKYWKALKNGLPTINIRDIAIQERENDLVLASFGRGFYILDNYASLREIAKENIEKNAHLFAVKDALIFNTYTPLGGLGSKERGFQGEDFYSAPNPEKGPTFTYWIKETVTSLKSERQKKEKDAFKKGKAIPYPSLNEFKAENSELPSYLIFTINDENGKFIRELRSPLKKGLNKLTWDMCYPQSELVNARQAAQNVALPSSPVYVLPGKYTVSLAKNEKGELTELSAPIAFELKEINNRTIPAEDRKLLASFKLKAVRLLNALDAAENIVETMNEKIAQYKAAVKGLRAKEANVMYKEILALEFKVKQLEIFMYGDRDFNPLDLVQSYAIVERAQSALGNIMGSTSNIPAMSERDYKIAAEEFFPLLSDIRNITSLFDDMDKKLGDLGAPLTLGRLPNWEK